MGEWEPGRDARMPPGLDCGSGTAGLSAGCLETLGDWGPGTDASPGSSSGPGSGRRPGPRRVRALPPTSR